MATNMRMKEEEVVNLFSRQHECVTKGTTLGPLLFSHSHDTHVKLHREVDKN